MASAFSSCSVFQVLLFSHSHYLMYMQMYVAWLIFFVFPIWLCLIDTFIGKIGLFDFWSIMATIWYVGVGLLFQAVFSKDIPSLPRRPVVSCIGKTPTLSCHGRGLASKSHYASCFSITPLSKVNSAGHRRLMCVNSMANVSMLSD